MTDADGWGLKKTIRSLEVLKEQNADYDRNQKNNKK